MPAEKILGFFSEKRTVAFSLLFLGVVFSLWIFARWQLRGVQQDLAATESRVKAAQEKLASRQDKKAGLQMRALKEALPRDADKPRLVLEFVNLATKNRVQDLSFRIEEQRETTKATGEKSAPSAGDQFGSFSINSKFSASWKETGLFLEDVRKSSYPFSVQSLEIKRGDPLPAAHLVVRVYYVEGKEAKK